MKLHIMYLSETENQNRRPTDTACLKDGDGFRGKPGFL